MNKILTIQSQEDIPADFRATPISDLLLYHNANMSHKNYEQPTLLIGMCMDNRNNLSIPKNFAYILRAGGTNFRSRDFHASYAIAVGGLEHMVLIGHTQCGMVNLELRKDLFIKGLADHAGWDAKSAEEHFLEDSPKFEIHNEMAFILSEAARFSKKYPKVKVAPLLFRVEDKLLYWISS